MESWKPGILALCSWILDVNSRNLQGNGGSAWLSVSWEYLCSTSQLFVRAKLFSLWRKDHLLPSRVAGVSRGPKKCMNRDINANKEFCMLADFWGYKKRLCQPYQSITSATLEASLEAHVLANCMGWPLQSVLFLCLSSGPWCAQMHNNFASRCWHSSWSTLLQGQSSSLAFDPRTAELMKVEVRWSEIAQCSHPLLHRKF